MDEFKAVDPEKGAKEKIKSVVEVLASELTTPVILIYSEDGSLKLHQMSSSKLPPKTIASVLNQLDQGMLGNLNDDENLTGNAVDDESDDEGGYDVVAKLIDEYDKEEGVDDIKSIDSVTELLGSIIGDADSILDRHENSDSISLNIRDVNEKLLDDFKALTIDEAPLDVDAGAVSPDNKIVLQPVSSQNKDEASGIEMDLPQPHKLPSDLKTTPLLKRHGLLFNVIYKLLICEACRRGLPLSTVVAHLSNSLIREWNSTANKLLTVPAHHPRLTGTSTLTENKIFQDMLIQSLIENRLIRSAEEVLNGSDHGSWRKNKVAPDGTTPVQGIQVYDGISCRKCPMAGRAYGPMRKHVHGPDNRTAEKTDMTNAKVQTFSERFSLFYVVDSEAVLPQNSALQEFTDNSVLDLLHKEQNRIMDLIPPSTNLPLAPSAKALPPIFHVGIEQWLKRIDRAKIFSDLELPEAPKKNSKKKSQSSFARLRRVLFTLFAEDLNILLHDQIHHEVGHIITNGSWKTNRRPFTPLTLPNSICTYFLAELKLVWNLLNFWRKSTSAIKEAGDSLSAVFYITPEHEKSFEDLDKSLVGSFNASKITNALRRVFDLLYFPSVEERERAYHKPIHVYPLLQFIIYSFVNSEGVYHPIHILPPILAKHQYSVRLRGLYKINDQVTRNNNKNWRSITSKFCDDFLADFGDAPFNTIRYWMHGLSVLAKNMPRPNMVWWRGDVILVLGHEICFNRYRENMYRKVLELEAFILEEVVCGLFTMEKLEELFRMGELMDLGDETTLGYGVVADTTTPLMSTPESTIFFQLLFSEKKFGLRAGQNGGLLFDHDEALHWLASINLAYRQLVPACHTLIISGRGTEWEFIRPTNNQDGRRGVVFDPDAKTGAFDSEYHKGLSNQGINKHNRRYMPYEIFRLLFLLVRVIRPIELTLLLGALIRNDKKPATIQAYHNNVFASMGKAWTSEDISNALQDWLKDITGFSMGLHDYRHLAIAIQRKYMDLSDTVPTEMETTLNHLRGHQKNVGDAHYARLTHLGTCPPDERARAYTLAKQYHQIMGFTTGYGEELPPESKKLRQEFESSIKEPISKPTAKSISFQAPVKRISRPKHLQSGPVQSPIRRVLPARAKKREVDYRDEL